MRIPRTTGSGTRARTSSTYFTLTWPANPPPPPSPHSSFTTQLPSPVPSPPSPLLPHPFPSPSLSFIHPIHPSPPFHLFNHHSASLQLRPPLSQSPPGSPPLLLLTPFSQSPSCSPPVSPPPRPRSYTPPLLPFSQSPPCPPAPASSSHHPELHPFPEPRRKGSLLIFGQGKVDIHSVSPHEPCYRKTSYHSRTRTRPWPRRA